MTARAQPGAEWRAAYRLQLRPGFDFESAADLLDYLADLGVSHVYCSPIAEAGSDHGYDVVDPTRIRDELGGRDGFDALVGAARERGLGMLLDVVPNHMATGGSGSGNRWWWDVLEHGRTSPHSEVFDIVWAEALDGRLLVPILDDHLRHVLDDGRLKIERTTEHTLHLCYSEHRFPLRPRSTTPFLRRAAARVDDPVLPILTAQLDELDGVGERRGDLDRVAAAVRAHLAARPDVVEALDGVLEETNGDAAAIDAVTRQQHYRLARWQLANREITYRRFFDVTELVAVRADVPAVFDQTHALVVELVRDGAVDGLRIDHPDGLRDPEAYLERLAECSGAAPVWVEKILSPGEALPTSWPVDGTTGYDFSDLVGRLLVDTDGVRSLRRWFTSRTGEPEDFHEVARASKHAVLERLLGADLDRVSSAAVRALDDAGWNTSHAEVRTIVAEVVAALPVYRTYVRPRRPAEPRDRALLKDAARLACDHRRELDREVVDALVDTMLTPASASAADLVGRFQQLCASATAKGVEDTAFYRWGPLASLCEVGSHPDGAGVEPAQFHEAVCRAAERWPARLLETSTHDSKRSEDVRARLNVLSEDAPGWTASADRILELSERHLGHAPRDRALEILALQTAVGAWPIDADRLVAWLVKAAREAKRQTSWLEPDSEFEAAVEKWGRALVEDTELRAAIDQVTAPLIWPGRTNSLAQVVLKSTCPGVAGIYQGTELWGDSLVDPDNRRPVDFARRRALAARARQLDARAARDATDDGTLKLWTLRRVLELRRRNDALCATAMYDPLVVRGPGERHVVAYCRGGGVIVVIPRLTTMLTEGDRRATVVELPAGRWHDVLGTGDAVEGRVPVDALLAPVPVAVLERVG